MDALYLLINEQVAGPYAPDTVKQMWHGGAVNGLTKCCVEGTEQWFALAMLASEFGWSTHPGVPANLPPQLPDKVITTQGTGKRLKLHYLFAILTVVIGMVVTLFTAVIGDVSPLAVWVWVLGMIWAFVVRFMTWWHHA